MSRTARLRIRMGHIDQDVIEGGLLPERLHGQLPVCNLDGDGLLYRLPLLHLDPVPEEMKPKTLEEIEAKREAAAQPTRRKAIEPPPKSNRARLFNVYVEDEFFQVEVDPARSSDGTGGRILGPSTQPTRAKTPVESAAPAANETTIVSPMPGIVVRYLVEVGQAVQAGDSVVVLEAMKMENSLPSPIAGTVKSLPLEPGSTVAKEDVLAIITP